MSTSLSTRPRRRRIGSLIALATAAILAACGGGGGGEAAPEVPTGDGTSFEAPLPAGTEIELTEGSETVWKIQVTGVNWNASDANWTESEAGTYALVDVKVTRTGADPADPYMNIWWDLFDLDGNEFDESMFMAPNDLFNIGDLAEGESATGQLIFEVPEGLNQGILSFSTISSEDTFVVAN